jgi:hypothetical protein
LQGSVHDIIVYLRLIVVFRQEKIPVKTFIAYLRELSHFGNAETERGHSWFFWWTMLD